jgi:NADP-dependent 3-hydroxy acid dehydrogenase YdfG
MAEALHILITGATSGIGRAAAVRLAGEGHRVIASGRRPDELEKLAAEAGVQTLILDVARSDSIKQAGEKLLEMTGGHGVDVLVNNAGFARMAPIEHVTEEDLREQFETNVFGLVRVGQMVLPKMRGRGSGKIINVSSVVGRVSIPLQGVYNATKHAVEALSDAWRVEADSFGVRVVLVEPGAIGTNFDTTVLARKERYQSLAKGYQPAMAGYEKQVKKMYSGAVGPERVAKTISRIVRKRRPHARYVVPWANRFAIFFYKITPTCILDAVMSRLMGLRRALGSK